jgi:hypothetical protein
MKLLEPVKRYFEAWNLHDGGAIAACFDSGGGGPARCRGLL